MCKACDKWDQSWMGPLIALIPDVIMSIWIYFVCWELSTRTIWNFVGLIFICYPFCGLICCIMFNPAMMDPETYYKHHRNY